MKNYYLNFTNKKTVEIAEEDRCIEAMDQYSVAGHTVFSMISAGSEINASYLDVFDWGYPRKSGYTVIFQVEYVGSKVEGVDIGDYVFYMDAHQSFQIAHYLDVVKIPKDVRLENALFIRLAGVSMATLSKTAIKPGEKVLVTGLGTVGLMAMLVYSNLGYEVIGVDPDANRRETAKGLGFCEIYDSVPLEKYSKSIGLALECSGNEAAVHDCCKVVRPHGEVSLIGVPWKPYTDLKSFDLLNSIFYNYVKVYSGWEMDLPMNGSEFIHESMRKNYQLSLKLIQESKIKVDDLYTVLPYTECQKAFDDIFEKREKKAAIILSYKGV